MCSNVNALSLVCADNAHCPAIYHTGKSFRLFCKLQNPRKHQKCFSDGFGHNSVRIPYCILPYMGAGVGPGNKWNYYIINCFLSSCTTHEPHTTYVCTYVYKINALLSNVLASHAVVRIRVAVTGLLLKHSINLHLQTVASVSIGKIMSLLSTDVHRFDQVRLQMSPHLHAIQWIYVLLTYLSEIEHMYIVHGK